jgi:hypothetical protein
VFGLLWDGKSGLMLSGDHDEIGMWLLDKDISEGLHGDDRATL